MPTSLKEAQALHAKATAYYSQFEQWFAYLASILAPTELSNFYAENTKPYENMVYLASKQGISDARKIAHELLAAALPGTKPFFSIEMDEYYEGAQREFAEQQVELGFQSAGGAQAGVSRDSKEFADAVQAMIEDFDHLHKEFRQALTTSLLAKLNDRGSFNLSLDSIIHSLVIYGNAAFSVNYYVKQNFISVDNIPISSIRVPNQPTPGLSDCLFKLDSMTVAEAEKYWEGRGQKITRPTNDYGDNKVDFVMMQKRNYGGTNSDPDTYEITLYDTTFKHEWLSFERIVPIVVFARDKMVSGHKYGIGIGAEAIVGNAEIRNSATRDFLRAANFAANPAYLVDSDLLNEGRLNLRPGEYVPVDGLSSQPEAPIQPLGIGGNHLAALDVIHKATQDIAIDTASQPGTAQAPKDITAYQWRQQAEQDAARRTQPLQAIEFNVLRPVVAVSYELARQEGILDIVAKRVANHAVPPLDTGELKLRFAGADIALMRERRVANYRLFMESVVIYYGIQNPTFHAFAPEEKWLRELALLHDIPPHIYSSPREFRERVIEFQQQQQQLMAQAQQQEQPPQ